MVQVTALNKQTVSVVSDDGLTSTEYTLAILSQGVSESKRKSDAESIIAFEKKQEYLYRVGLYQQAVRETDAYVEPTP